MLESPVGKTLRELTIPMIVGIIAVLLFGLVDTFFVSLLGTDPLAAIGFTVPIGFIVMSITMGFAIGLAAVLSKTLGEGDHSTAVRLTTDNLLLSVLVVSLVVIIGIATIEPLFTALGATNHIMPYIKDYMVLWYIGSIFLVIPIVGNGALRATGDMKTPSVLMIISALINAILDPLFIFGIGPFPEMGIQGAGLATLISWLVSCVVSLWILSKSKKLISFTPQSFSTMIVSWKPVLYIALPAGLTNLLIPVSTAILTAMVAKHGVEAVAAFGVGIRVEALAMVVIMSLSTALLPFIGQNLGAKNNERVLSAVSISLKFCLWFQVLVYFILIIFSSLIAGAFSNDPKVIEIVILFLFILPISYSFQGMMMLSGSVMNALNKPVEVTVLSIIRLFVLFIPFAYMGALLADVKGLFWGLVIASIIASGITYVWLKRTLRILQPVNAY